MSKLISIRDNLYEKLKELKGIPSEQDEDTLSFSQVLDNLLAYRLEALNKDNELTETTVTQEGRISKTLAGKTILYKVKE